MYSTTHSSSHPYTVGLVPYIDDNKNRKNELAKLDKDLGKFITKYEPHNSPLKSTASIYDNLLSHQSSKLLQQAAAAAAIKAEQDRLEQEKQNKKEDIPQDRKQRQELIIQLTKKLQLGKFSLFLSVYPLVDYGY